MASFTETILGQEVTIEVWGGPADYAGYAFCPFKGHCPRYRDVDAFTAARRFTEGRAKSAVRESIRAHLKRVHKL